MQKSIKNLIQEHYDTLSESNQKVAKFVIDNYQQSTLMGSTELAKAAGVSNTAVIRFAKALGFSGFIEYKKRLKQEHISTQKVYSYLNLMKPAGENGHVSTYLSALNKDFESFTASYDLSLIDAFCTSILKAKHLYLMGIGSDEITVTFLHNYLNIMGIHCIPITQEGLTLREHLFQINSEDVLLISAFPTTLNDERWATMHAKKQNAKILAITDSEITAKELNADFCVRIKESQDVFFNSYSLVMAFCNTLLLRLYELSPVDTAQSMKDYEEMLQECDI